MKDFKINPIPSDATHNYVYRTNQFPEIVVYLYIDDYVVKFWDGVEWQVANLYTNDRSLLENLIKIGDITPILKVSNMIGFKINPVTSDATHKYASGVVSVVTH